MRLPFIRISARHLCLASWSWMAHGGARRRRRARRHRRTRRRRLTRRASSPLAGCHPPTLCAPSILRREFSLDAPLKEAVDRGWMMTLTFGGFSGPLYAWLDGTFVGFSADGFIPAAFDVTGALQPTHTHTLVVLLMESPVCCHGLFREVSVGGEARRHTSSTWCRVASHDGRAGARDAAG